MFSLQHCLFHCQLCSGGVFTVDGWRELKVYLQQRRLSVSGTKLDLASQAPVAYKHTSTTVLHDSLLKADYKELLRTYKLELDPKKVNKAACIIFSGC